MAVRSRRRTRKRSVCAANFVTRCSTAISEQLETNLKNLGVETRRGGVTRVDVSGLSSAAMVDRIRDSIAGTPAAFEYVADISSTEPGSVFAWLIELGIAGDFRQASEAFRSAAAIVDRLFVAGIGGIGA